MRKHSEQADQKKKHGKDGKQEVIGELVGPVEQVRLVHSLPDSSTQLRPCQSSQAPKGLDLFAWIEPGISHRMCHEVPIAMPIRWVTVGTDFGRR